MGELVWHQPGTQKYELGVSNGMFYPRNRDGEVWNGLVSLDLDETAPSEVTLYLDGRAISRTFRRPTLFGTIEAFTYPETFYDRPFLNQKPQTFDLSYRTRTDASENLHLLYNVLIESSVQSRQQEEATLYSWEFSTTPALIQPGVRSSHLIVEVDVALDYVLEDLENILYGSDDETPRMPKPEEVLAIFEQEPV